ncbi:MAG: ATP-binding protein, partial [Chloroflexota bacterium]
CATAINLYGGAYLPDALYDDWAAARRQELSELYLALLLHQADLQAGLGETAQAAHSLRLALATDACNEQATGKLMTVLAASGARAEASQAYNALENSLREELGLSPSPEIHAVYTRIMAYPTNLPAPLTSFIGRDAELASVVQLLDSARLLSLVGAGGVGKTRLALQAAAAVLYHYQDGTWFVDLARVTEPQGLPQVVMGTLGVPEHPNQPLLSTLIEHLRDKHLLLVIDNCEHVLTASVDFIAEILTACPEVRVLATSREALAVAGEIAWQVPPLSMNGAHDLGQFPAGPASEPAASEAARLFLAHLRASRPGLAARELDLSAIERICRRLEGLPLAIELAAARAGSIPLEHIEARLDDRFALLTRGPRTARPRQQTLRATMDWSYGLLDESEQHLLCRLSVFAGGCTLEGIAAVAGLESNAPAVQLTLERLSAKSLARRLATGDEPRYGLLETIRQYGALRLGETGDGDQVRRRHALWYLEQQEVADSAWY